MFNSLFPTEGPQRPVACGIEAGITLAKVALCDASGKLRCFFVRFSEIDAVLEPMRRMKLQTIGVTGRGALGIKLKMGDCVRKYDEFEACGVGARYLMRAGRHDVNRSFVVTDVGTGTSVIAVEGRHVRRLGGTALGGGALIGLCRAITRRNLSYAEIAELIKTGDRARVDLQVHDVYEGGEVNIAPSFTASNFGRVALSGMPEGQESDLVLGVIGMIGENIALLSCSLADTIGCRTVCYGGTTLRNIESLTKTLCDTSVALGKQALVLPHCEYLGALGALELCHPSQETVRVGGDKMTEELSRGRG